MKPLHHKTYTLAKRGLSLLCILALCLSLLPVTALAAGEDAPATLYVGETQITGSGYWKTNDDGTLTADGASESNYDVCYDGNGILTLNNAKIQGGNDSQNPQPKDYGIYAASTSGQSVALTINLIGTNTVSGYCGIYVEASDGDSTLVIQSDTNGSLETSGSGWNGITMSSNSGNVSLTINNASVEASTGRAGYYGVSLASYATSSPTLSLTVNGGSLTAQGDPELSGIRYVSKRETNSSTSLMVRDGALIKAIPDISASGPSKPTPQAESGSGGIVFEGNSGTVYGSVTLDESLTINEGESLTIPEGSTLDTNGNLTNNGTINVEDGGKLEGEPGGTIVSAPTITTESLPEGTAGQPYTATLEATGNDITWSASDLPDGLTLDADTGAITGTPTTEGQFPVTVTATNSAGITTKQYTLDIKPATVPVTGVTLDKTTLELFTGNTATLTAKVEPADATNQAVTWSSDKPEVATVDANGIVTAVSAGTATITATAADGSGKSATCTVTVTDKTYTISADTTALDFGSAYTGYAQPAAQTVTLTNTGNQPVTLTQPASTNSFEVGTLSKMELAVGETASFTVQPKTGLSVGTYSDTITVSGSENVTVTIPASFTVKSRPSYNPPTVSEETTDAIQAADPGETVTVDLSSGSTKLDKEVFEALAGRDVTLVIDLGDDVSWTVKGSDVPEDADFTDIDMGVTMNSDGIPVDVVNAITGERDSVQLTLAHDGAFGFTMTLTTPLGKENAGYWANLYHYDEDAEALNFEAAAKIDEDGSVTIPFSHASQYAIVIDDHSHATVDVSDLFIDIAPDAWYKDAIQYAYDNGLMTGTSATTFEPEATTTRAMIVSILARLEGVESAQAAGFADVDDNDWYATAVNWAANAGVVNGYEDNTFQPNTAITREQLAAILMNYAAYKGEDVSNRADLTSYTDQPSTWAEEAISWSVAEGLLTGVTADTLQPQGAATRAQVAAILQRYLEA